MRKVRLKLRRKGQVTLPAAMRRLWSVEEGSELSLSFNEDYATLKPIKRIDVRGSSGALGSGDEDEVELAVLDPEFVPVYYEGKYGDSRG